MTWTVTDLRTDLHTGTWSIGTSDGEQTIGQITGVAHRPDGTMDVLRVATTHGLVLVAWAEVTRLVRVASPPVMPPPPTAATAGYDGWRRRRTHR